MPSTKYGAIVSIADKVETLISIFISGRRPSGSSDPYALRRNLNGVIKIIWDYELNLPLDKLFKEINILIKVSTLSAMETIAPYFVEGKASL